MPPVKAGFDHGRRRGDACGGEQRRGRVRPEAARRRDAIRRDARARLRAVRPAASRRRDEAGVRRAPRAVPPPEEGGGAPYSPVRVQKVRSGTEMERLGTDWRGFCAPSAPARDGALERFTSSQHCRRNHPGIRSRRPVSRPHFLNRKRVFSCAVASNGRIRACDALVGRVRRRPAASRTKPAPIAAGRWVAATCTPAPAAAPRQPARPAICGVLLSRPAGGRRMNSRPTDTCVRRP